MTIWSILGIEPTKDVREIKKQYARKLKTCHPEDNPEEFIELEKAYHSAIEYAKSSHVHEEIQEEYQDEIQDKENQSEDVGFYNNKYEHIDTIKEIDELFKSDILLDGISYEKQVNQSEDIESFISILNKKYDKYMLCASDTTNYWLAILKSTQCQQLIENPMFLEQLIDFFCRHSIIFTKDVVRNELLPFFQSLSIYNYGERQEILSDFINKLIMMETKLSKPSKVPRYKDTYGGRSWKISMACVILWVIIMLVYNFVPSVESYNKINRDSSYVEQLLEQKEESYINMFLEAGLITSEDEIIGDETIEGHIYKNERSRMRARIISFAVKNNLDFEIIEPVFNNIARENGFDSQGYPISYYYNYLLSCWGEESSMEFDEETKKTVKNKHSQKEFYKSLFDFVETP